MLSVRRTVRFAINPGSEDAVPADVNGFAGVPAPRGLARWYELDVTCRGEPDEPSGYLVNISEIDRAVREAAIPLIGEACRTRPEQDPGELLPVLVRALGAALPAPLANVTWRLSPYYNVSMDQSDMTTALLRQSFEFAASHRLHVPELSSEKNRELFGKCNNPNGHGHNYRVEPTVAVRLDVDADDRFTLADLERVVDEAVISHFDHKHLNRDLPEFADLNPSVEHIARVVFDRLKHAIASNGAAVELRSVTIWETEKTSCTYPA